ncbi:hypothetical protein HUJ05_009837 [Dendroctonus ponderosae]|nr:hypothetical protein HUJ05_009837 [Dendroctonus ponderosae]
MKAQLFLHMTRSRFAIEQEGGLDLSTQPRSSRIRSVPDESELFGDGRCYSNRLVSPGTLQSVPLTSRDIDILAHGLSGESMGLCRDRRPGGVEVGHQS